MTGSRSWQGHDGGKVMTREASDRAPLPTKWRQRARDVHVQTQAQNAKLRDEVFIRPNHGSDTVRVTWLLDRGC